MRKNNRKHNEARNLSIVPNYQKNSIGSVLIKFEDTQVICSTNISNHVPRWLLNKNQGWITAEYGMLPRSTHTRTNREATRGKQSGRTQEIQRLIGRSLRAVTNLKALGEMQIRIDCEEWIDSTTLGEGFIAADWAVLEQVVNVLEYLLLQGKVSIKQQPALV